jgi:membrane protease YdiL (CAAX protease family)
MNIHSPNHQSTHPTTHKNNKNIRLALFWAVLGGFGTLAGFPYILSLMPPSATPPVPLPILAIAGAIQSAVVMFFLSWIGLYLGRSLGLDTPFARAFVYGAKLPKVSKIGLRLSLVSGLLGGAILVILALLFQPLMPQTPVSTSLNIDLWKRLLAAFYGGITEEILLRLFLMTLIIWLLWKGGMKTKNHPTKLAFWIAIAAAALIFAIAHLPVAVSIWTLTPIVVIRTILLNSLLGVAFGYIYWRCGLEYAIFSHFLAGLVLHGIGGS